MNTIEDRLREHYGRRADAAAPGDWSAQVIKRGKRLQVRRRVMAGAAALITVVAGLGIVQVARDVVGPGTEGFVPAGAVPAAERAAHEDDIAGYLEKHDHFSWIDDSGGRVVCATQELGQQPGPHSGQQVFVWALCEARDGGVGSSTGVPLAVTLDVAGEPVTLAAPGDGSEYGRIIKQHFPRELWDDVFEQRIDHARLQRDLDARAERTR